MEVIYPPPQLNALDERVTALEAGYKPGDKLTASWHGAGYVTNGKALIGFAVPVRKPVLASQINVGGDMICRQGGNYVYGNANTGGTLKGSAWYVDAGYIIINATVSLSSAAVNNDAVGIVAHLDIGFG